ncbi:ribosome-associated translation inhibitor RaiA [Neiella marina]|uniref:Ribosome-associated translation inhibitor RaiA n=1 Tax=Neiella holothuriorum TaxID=2870530 RepID=A0ABS7EF50_9GAMM|nr:ribosome-associated translation inhibitor RaiA [Neiella holothuriorum]MBW8190850.1 ribosome-associated translation inhibitor RaiA [Neiella holothuriorum]
MNIEITCKTMPVTPSIREHISYAFSKLERLDAQLINPHVIVEKDGSNIIVEARLFIPGTELFAKASHENFQVATNRLVDKLKQQLLRHRGKINTARNQAA